MKLFYYSLLTAGPNKLEHLSLETLSSQVLKFEGRPEPTQLKHISDASFLGKFFVLPANGTRGWKVIASYKQSCLFGLVISDEWKKSFITLTPGINVVKLFYSLLLTAGPNKLECLLLAFFSGQSSISA
jgi:hypothetical protein